MQIDWKKNLPKSNIYFETNNGILYNADCLDIMSQIPSESIDLVLTDPPYNASNSKISSKKKCYKAINENWDKQFRTTFVDYLPKLLIKGGSTLIWTSHHLLGNYLNQVDLKLQQILHWFTTNPMPSLTKCYAFSIEYCLWFVKKGSPYIFNKNCRFSYRDVFESKVNSWKQTNHPAEKNLSIINALVATHSNSDSLVLDPFMGSGTTALACEMLGRRWIGIEISQQYCEMAKNRITHLLNSNLFTKENYDKQLETKLTKVQYLF